MPGDHKQMTMHKIALSLLQVFPGHGLHMITQTGIESRQKYLERE